MNSIFYVHVGILIGLFVFGYLIGRTKKIMSYEDKIRYIENRYGEMQEALEHERSLRKAATEPPNL